MFLGIDLAGTKENTTGLACLNDEFFVTSVHTDEDILDFIETHAPTVTAIDAPLSFHGKPFRDGDQELQKEYSILPLTFKGMRKLTQRGIKLKEKIAGTVIETYPYASRKKIKDRIFTQYTDNIHEEDALISAFVARAYYYNTARCYGNQDRIYIL